MGVGEEAAQTVLTITSKTAMMTTEMILELLKALTNRLKSSNINKSNSQNVDIKSGKQSIKQLSKQNVTLDSIPVTNIDIKQITSALKRYGVDFSVTKNRSTQDFNLFFKATDTAVISSALEQIVADNDKSNKDHKKPLKEQKEEAQEKADKRNAERAVEKSQAQTQEQQKNRSGREKER
jgi:hypothetical protein